MRNFQKLYAGYARVDITPDFSVGLDGYHNEETRRSEGVRDPIYLTCIAVAEGEQTILLFDADLLSINDWLAEKIQSAVCPVTGIPADKVFCGATHTHSGPANYNDEQYAVRYRKLLMDAAVEAAQAALADLAPAQLLCSVKVIKGMNFVRHYLMEDGSYSGSGFGNHDLLHVAHAAESDPRLLLVQFAREGKKDIVLMNWQAHNDNVSAVGRNLISSSFTGQIRAKFEQETGMHFAYFTGAAGNQNPGSLIESEKHGLDYIAYGQKMAQYAMEAMKNLKPVTGSGIETKRVILQAQVNHSWDHMLDKANEVFHVWKTVGYKEAHTLGKTYGFSSPYQTKFIRMRADMGQTMPVTLNAFRIGDLAFVTTPNDTFSTVGLHVRLHGPFENTVVITGNARYMPCMAAYEYRSYEADSSLYAKGTAEKAAETLVEMLESIR